MNMNTARFLPTYTEVLLDVGDRRYRLSIDQYGQVNESASTARLDELIAGDVLVELPHEPGMTGIYLSPKAREAFKPFLAALAGDWKDWPTDG